MIFEWNRVLFRGASDFKVVFGKLEFDYTGTCIEISLMQFPTI